MLHQQIGEFDKLAKLDFCNKILSNQYFRNAYLLCKKRIYTCIQSCSQQIFGNCGERVPKYGSDEINVEMEPGGEHIYLPK